MDYSTYLGGIGLDQGLAVAVDGSGNAYVTGRTISTNFPATGGALDTTCGISVACSGNISDAFVTKINAAGSATVYTTYLGGDGLDQANAIKVDGSGNAYVTGVTISTNFPLTAIRFQAANGGGGDVFISKLNSTGSGLLYSSYIGGAGMDEGLGIALDGSNNAYVTGDTTSDPFPTSVGAFQTAAPSGGAAADGFVSKFNPAAASNAASLVYSTHLGGAAGADKGRAIAVDGSGNAYIAGETLSSNFPTTAGVVDLACGSEGACDGGLASDAFVTKLNATGTALVYSTFLGGADNDRGLGIALDASNNAYVTGVSESVDFPTTAGVLQISSAGGFEAFVTKLNATATALTYSTYLGGNGFDQGNSIAVDGSGRAYVAGATGSTDFPLASPVQTTCASCPASTDAFLAKLNANATAVVFSTYLGGFTDDTANGVALDASPNAYIAGSTTSADFPTIGTPIQATTGGSSDVFVSKISGMALPVASLSVTSLNFGDIVAGFTSPSQAVTLTNRGDVLLNITGIDTSGDYAQTDDCGAVPTTLAAGASCTFTVTFTPTGTGTRDGALTITDDAYGSPHVVNLTGTGSSQAIVGLLPGTLAFGSQRVGTTSAVKAVTLTNSGTGALDITSIVTTTDYNVDGTSTCGATVAAGANCVVNVTFSPTVLGVNSGTLTITDDAAGSPRVVTLSGTGVVGVDLAPPGLTFADTLVGVDSATQTVTLTNNGNAVVTISSVSLASADFSQTNDCPVSPATLPAGGFCTLTVKARPTATGSRLGEISISDDAPTPGSTQSVSLSVNGIAPAATVLPLSLTFASRLVGTTSAGQSFTLQNTGTADLHISSIVGSGDFALTSAAPCGAFPVTMVPGAPACTITVTFTPTASGTRLGAVTITDDSGAATHVDTVSLDGTGVAPAVSFAPLTLDFGSQLVGSTSASKSVVLTNSGTSTLTVTNIVLPSADFTLTSATPCGPLPATIAPAANCTLTVTFKPTTTDIRRAGITITDDAADSPQTVNLSGTGIAPAVTFAPVSITFDNQIVGTTSAAKTATLTNNGTSPLTITAITLVGTDFAFTNPAPCGALPATLAINATCTFSITFTPTTTDIRRGGITITDDAGDSPQTLALSGTGTAPGVSLSPPTVSFSDQAVNTTSAPQAIALQNSGSAPLTISSIVLASTDFALTSATPCGPLPATLAVSATCTMSVTFTPTATDIRRAGITITDDAPGSPHIVSLSGLGTAPAAGFTPAELDFGNQAVGVASATKTAVLTNTGGAPLVISNITISGDFSQINTCGALPATIAPNATCTFTITFTPSAPDVRRGAVTVFDNAGGSPHALSLSGFGATPGVAVTPDLLTYSSQGVGTTSAGQTAVLKNNGTAPLTITGITVSGDFALASATPCGAFPATLAAGASCNLAVTFTPTTTDVRHGAVSIVDNALGSPHVVGLSGTGATPFELSTAVNTATVNRGVDSTTYTINATSAFGFTGDIALSCTGTESASCVFNPASVKPGQSSTLTLSPLTPLVGNFLTFAVHGQNGLQAASLDLTLLISDFTVTPGAGSSTSATVTAGQPATYSLTFTPAYGFTGTVSLTCSGNPVRSTCAINPTSVSLDGVNPATVTVTVSTTARAVTTPGPASRHSPPGIGTFSGFRPQMLLLLALLAGMISAGAVSRRLRHSPLVLAAVLIMALLWAACGGETASVPPGDVGTPAGTYNITITATSATSVHTTTLALKVN
ncbi:MAG: beta strand repeat-containing protein [Terriglobia bacterium]